MFRVLVAPDFEITSTDPDFPPALLDTLKSARDITTSNYVSFWAQAGEADVFSRVVVSTYPTQWLRRYTEKDYSRIDPVLTKGLQSVNAVIFDHAHPETAELAELATEAMEHGIGAYTVGIPVHIGKNIHSVTTFATDLEIAADTDEASALMTRYREQANIVALAVADLYLKDGRKQHKLTEREVEVLYWGSRGKTDQQTADIMRLSRWTVVAHVQSAKAKLRVNNKAAAIARALELNILSTFKHKL